MAAALQPRVAAHHARWNLSVKQRLKHMVKGVIAVANRWPILRIVLAIICFLIAIPLMFIPGPAIVFWLMGLLLLGVSMRQIILFFKRLGVKHEAVDKVADHPWVKKIDRLFSRKSGAD